MVSSDVKRVRAFHRKECGYCRYNRDIRKVRLFTYGLGLAILGLALLAREASAKSVHHYMVTRTAANHYVTAEGLDIYTRDCTVTARLMDVTVVYDDPFSTIYFLDSEGEVEGECKLR